MLGIRNPSNPKGRHLTDSPSVVPASALKNPSSFPAFNAYCDPSLSNHCMNLLVRR